MNLIQIGSHKGYDDFSNIVKNYTPEDISFLLLIEPNQEFNESLRKCYMGFNPIIENIVVNTNEKERKTKFYSCNKTKYPDSEGSNYSELSSLIKPHLIKHGIIEEFIEENEIECETLNNTLERHKIYELDILFIDVEGFDFELLKSIDYNKFNIKKIYYENMHVNDDSVVFFLETKGYMVKKNILLNGWSNEAIKK